MDRIWQAHWPPGVDEARIRLPDDSLPTQLKATAARLPRKTALIFYGRKISFAELDEASDRFAAWLRGRGVGPGDRVALYLENCPQFAVAHFGALKVGAITVALNPMHKAHELGHELEDSGARVVVAADAGREVVESVRDRTALDTAVLVSYRDYLPEEPTLPLPPSLLEQGPQRGRGWEDFAGIVGGGATLRALEPRARHDTALIQYTSGTTGAPKGAELTHGNVTANCELIRAFFDITPADVLLGVVPWFHITGMEVQLNLMAYTGATLVALHRFEVETALRAIQRYRCTVTTLIATINVAILNHEATPTYDLTSLRLCTSGGAPVPAEIARRWQATTGHPLVEGYGLTETTAPTHSNPPHRPRYGTVGVPLPYTGVRLVSLEDGVTEVGPGESGEIAVRGPMVTKGYWRQPAATAEAIPDGWLRTGDIGRVDDEGYFTVEERKKDLIKASGYSVFPAEVEAIMYRHPAVAEVGVVGVPDAYRGEDVLAFVVRQPGATASERELVDWCRAEMAVYKAPRTVRFVPALPKTGSGKIVKRALREQARAGSP
ncbi:MAG TPA: long-chain fatty acid--CoA ligase [Methylomirabilota bacterium]